jgi:outer membrane lipoprotein SlyB
MAAPNLESVRLPLAAVCLAVLTGCASTTAPVLYADAGARKANAEARLQSDVGECRQLADAAVGVNGANASKVATTSGKRGAQDFVDEAVEQIVANGRSAWNKARGAAAGVMAGSVTAAVLNWNEPDSVYRNYVDMCLKERGHKVLGWR